MVVNASRWRERACEIIGYVADEDLHRTAWFGQGPFISSPDEIYNQVFSDLDLENFITSSAVGLTDLQKAAATDLASKMNHFDQMMGGNLSPDKVVDHSAWREVREAARRLLVALGCPPISTTQD
jgi:hypothetical protein